MQARCMRCKSSMEMVDAHEEVSKNNMRMMKGKCVKCGTKMCKILGKA